MAPLPPYFKEPRLISYGDIDPGLDWGRYTFVLVIPENFEADVRLKNPTPSSWRSKKFENLFGSKIEGRRTWLTRLRQS